MKSPPPQALPAGTPPPSRSALPTFLRLFTEAFGWRSSNKPYPFRASWSAPSKLVWVFVGILGVAVTFFTLSFFMLTSRGPGFFFSMAKACMWIYGETASDFCDGMANTLFGTGIALVLLPGIFLVRRFKLKLSLAQLCVFSTACAIGLSFRIHQAAPPLEYNETVAYVLQTKPLAYGYMVLSSGLLLLAVQNLFRWPERVNVLLAGILPFCTPYLPVEALAALHALIVVIAATSQPRPFFPREKKYWPGKVAGKKAR